MSITNSSLTHKHHKYQPIVQEIQGQQLLNGYLDLLGSMFKVSSMRGSLRRTSIVIFLFFKRRPSNLHPVKNFKCHIFPSKSRLFSMHSKTKHTTGCPPRKASHKQRENMTKLCTVRPLLRFYHKLQVISLDVLEAFFWSCITDFQCLGNGK